MKKQYLLTSRLLPLILITYSGVIFAKDNKVLPVSAEKQIAEVQLGNALFFDANLSKNKTQSCATCHNPAHGFIDDRDNGVARMASLGDDGKSIGDRNAPTAGYAKFSPDFHLSSKENEQAYVGGQFWDGREADLAGQAGGPPLNPAEMGMPDKQAVIERLKENPLYQIQFKAIYGDDIFTNADKAYRAMTLAIASFEKSELFAPFDSKYDRFLKGEYELSVLEDLGRSLFFSNNNTNCSTCHLLKKEDALGETFTNYEFENIGTPTNVALRAKNGVAVKTIDHGLLNNPNVDDKKKDGAFKVPTLRNIAITGPYMHNGVFKDLRTVVLFYDKYNNVERKINPETGQLWAKAEAPSTIALEDLKAKALSDRKVDALVAFMELLTDKRFEPLLEE